MDLETDRRIFADRTGPRAPARPIAPIRASVPEARVVAIIVPERAPIEPVVAKPIPAEPIVAIAPTFHAVALESEIAAVLDAAAVPGDPIEASFRKKETDLRDLFAHLSVEDSYRLHERFATPSAIDPLAARFRGRLASDRRNRLLGFLSDARRRAAIPQKRK